MSEDRRYDKKAVCSVLGCEAQAAKIVLLHGTNYGQPVCHLHFDYYVEHSMVKGAVDFNKDVEEICGECGMAEANKISGLCGVCESAVIQENIDNEDRGVPTLADTAEVEPAFR